MLKSMAENKSTTQSLWGEIRRYLELNVEYAKLTAAEKVTILLTAIATVVVIGVLAVLVFFFVSLACVYWIGTAVSLPIAYSIMSGVYLLLLVAFIAFRRQLLLNPVAKFVSRLIMR